MLLAVDTSTRWVGLALYNGAQVLAEMIWQSQNTHTIEVAPAIQELLTRTGAHTTDLRAIGVATGPGSFTALRIGLGLAKGLALACHIPVVGVPSLDVLAAAQPARDLPMAAVLQAGRGRLALGWYAVQSGGWVAQGDPQVVRVEELAALIHKPTLVCGELSAEERQVLARKRKNVVLVSPAQSLRRPSYLAEIAWRRWQSGQVDDVVTLSPIYVHIAEAIPG
jgi:tRNA threonylcarbamoyladenosine biosynthesis protein TsaB